eukprot:155290_1
MDGNGSSYFDVLKLSIKSTRYFFILTGIAAFLNSSRSTIWVEYANSFHDSSMQSISWILFIDSVLLGIFGLFFASLGDYIGFDKSITIKVLFIVLGTILEAIATNFKMLSAGVLLSQTASLYVSLAYVAWILPEKYAKKQISLLYAIAGFSYLIGSVFSGILYKIFGNYQIIFIINAILMCLLLIYSLIFILGKQKKIEQLQISSCEYDENISNININDNDKTENDESKCDENLNELFPSFIQYEHAQNDNENKSKLTLHFWKEISMYHWYGIISIIVERAILIRLESLFIVYYIPFMLRKLDKSNKDYKKQNVVLLCTLQIMVMSVAFIISTVLISKYNHLLPTLYKYINPNLLIIILALLTIFTNSIFTINDTNIDFYLYFVFAAITGTCLGFSIIILDFLLLDIQPPQHAGKISGIKGLVKYIVAGLFLALVNWYWKFTENSMIYSVILGDVIIIVLSCISWISECVRT